MENPKIPEPPYIRTLKIIFLFCVILFQLFFLLNNAAGRRTYIVGVCLAMTIAWIFYLWKGERIGEMKIFPKKGDSRTVWYLRSGLSYVAGVVWFLSAIILGGLISIPQLSARIDSWINTDRDMVIFLILFMTIISAVTFFIVDKLIEFDESQEKKP